MEEKERVHLSDLLKYQANLQSQYKNLMEQEGNLITMKVKIEGALDVVNQMIEKAKSAAAALPAEAPKTE